MTAISYVSQKEMEQQTGFKTALGYSLPKEDKILLRKGLTKKKKKEVLAHEEEHIAKGEEGPFWQTVLQYLPQIIQGAGTLYSASQGSKAGDKAKKGSQKELDLIRESRDIVRADTRHTRQAGATALNALMRLTGLAGPGGGAQYDENGWPIGNEGGALLPGGDMAPPPKMLDGPDAREEWGGGGAKRFGGPRT